MEGEVDEVRGALFGGPENHKSVVGDELELFYFAFLEFKGGDGGASGVTDAVARV